MAILETELKWRKKTSFISGDKHYTRYVLVCGLIIFAEYLNNPFSASYTKLKLVISEREFPELHKKLEKEYSDICTVELLSKQNVTFSR